MHVPWRAHRVSIEIVRFMVCTLVLAIFFCATGQAGAAVLKSFSELRAVQSLADGGFAAIGQLKRADHSQQPGLIRIGANGLPLGGPVAIPIPANYASGFLAALERLPDGGLVAVGWVQAPDSAADPDAWLVRFDADGGIDWNRALPSKGDQKLYSVKLLSNGHLVAVGRDQKSQKGNDPSKGFAIEFDSEGNIQHKQTFSRGAEYMRSGFYDASELPDGSLAMVGWTTFNKADDVWLVRIDSQFKVMSNTSDVMEGPGIGWGVAANSEGVIVVGTMQKDNDGFVVLFDADLAKRGQPQLLQGGGSLRVVRSPSSLGPALVAGHIVKDGVVLPYLGTVNDGRLIDRSASTASSESQYFGVAVNAAAQLLLVGRSAAAGGGNFDGLVEIVSAPELCRPAERDLDAIGRALMGNLAVATSVCLNKGTTEIRLGGSTSKSAVLVTPLVGEVDAMLLRNGSVTDVSLNRGMTPELVMLPDDGAESVLAISASTAFASFNIARIALPDDTGGTETAVEGLTESRLPFLFDRLGYDQPNPNRTDKLAIRAFQAQLGHPPTGVVGADDGKMLFRQAARLIEPEAIVAAGVARTLAGRSASIQVMEQSQNDGDQTTAQDQQDQADAQDSNGVSDKEGEQKNVQGATDTSQDNVDAGDDVAGADGTDDGGATAEPPGADSLKTFAGGLLQGKLYGVGTFNQGSVFAGIWDYDAGSNSYKEREGVLSLTSGCTVALERMPDSGLDESEADGSTTDIGPRIDLPPALIVVRRGRDLALLGFSNADDLAFSKIEWRRSCFGGDYKTSADN